MSDVAPTTAAQTESTSVEAQAPESTSHEETTTAPASTKKVFKLKVDGEEFDEEIDFANEDDIKSRLQLSAAAKKRMAEAKEAKAKAFQIIKQFEDDPKTMLQRLGPKGRQIAEEYLLAQMQDEMLTPEEKEIRDLKRYKEMTEAEKKKTAELAAQKASQEAEYKYAQEYQATIIGALEKSGLPKSPSMVKSMARLMAKNLELGLELSPDDLALEAKRESQELLKSIIKDASGDDLIALFGEEIANKIRKSDLRKLKEKQSSFNRPEVSAKANRQAKSNDRPMSIDEWKEMINSRV